jgi:putative membrane protein
MCNRAARRLADAKNDPSISGRIAGVFGVFLHGDRCRRRLSVVYTRVTPHDEFQLIRDNVPSAAVALGFSLLGFVLPVVSAIAHSANVVDCLVWSAIALVVQIAVYFIVKIPVPDLSARIAKGELAPAIWLGLASLAAGALNAASMIY